MEEDNNIEEFIVDAITGRPHSFSVGDIHLALYPMTLGKMLLVQSVISTIGLSPARLKMNVSLEALRLVKAQKEGCLTIIAYHTYDKKEDILDTQKIKGRVQLMRDNLSDEEIATLFIITLTSDKTESLLSHFGIDKENERLTEVMKVKDTKNSLMFGGKSQYGMLIDMACERYGWTKDYVVWGIDFTSLRLMLADRVTSVYLSDDELKKVPALLVDRNPMDASDPSNAEKIKAIFANRGIQPNK